MSRLAPLAALAGLLALAACDQPSQQVVPAEGPVSDRISQLEKEVRALKDERDAAQRAGDAAGLEAQSLGQMLAALGKRLKAIEDAKPAAPAPAATGSEGGSSPAGTAPAPSGPITLNPAQPDGTFSDEQIAAFRKLDEEVQKRRRDEEQAKRLKQFLTTAGITLQPATEAALQKLRAAYGEKMQEILREGFGAGTDAERAERRDKIESLRKQFEADIRSVAPQADADKIVEGMLRTGSFPRRTDRTGMTGPTQPGR
jgi:hypothetical protein